MNNSRTRQSKSLAKEEYTKANREVKKSIKADKKKCIDDMAEEAENTVKTGNTRRLAGNDSKPERPVKDKAGATIMGKEELNRWAEHFEELLDRPTPPINQNQISTSTVKDQVNMKLKRQSSI